MVKKIVIVIVICAAYLAVGYIEAQSRENGTYKGPSGAKYEYDLSKIHDQLMYGLDAKAQNRDDLSSDTRIKQDRASGYSGGGILTNSEYRRRREERRKNKHDD